LYGFNGKENDNEVKGDGNQQDYGARTYDPRIGRFLSIDPKWREYSELSPYVFAANSPIYLVDVNGEGPGPIPSLENLQKTIGIIKGYGSGWFSPGKGEMIIKAVNSSMSNFGPGAYWRLAHGIAPSSFVGALGVTGEGIAGHYEFSFFAADYDVTFSRIAYHHIGQKGTQDFSIISNYRKGMRAKELVLNDNNADGTSSMSTIHINPGDRLQVNYEVKTISENSDVGTLRTMILRGYDQAIANAKANKSTSGNIQYSVL